MTIRLSEIQITKVSDVSSTPTLFSEDAFVVDGTNAGGGVPSDEAPKETITFVYGGLDAIPDGTSNTVFFSERYYLVDSQGSDRTTDTSTVATLQDFDWPSSSSDPVTFTYTVSVDPSDTTLERCFVKSWSTSGDADDRPTDDGADYSGSHVLYQDVFIPTVDTGPAVAIETITIAHEGYWL